MPVSKTKPMGRPVYTRSLTYGSMLTKSSVQFSGSVPSESTSRYFLESSVSGYSRDSENRLSMYTDKLEEATKVDLKRYCSARFRSSVQDFPEAMKALSKIRVTTYLPMDVRPTNNLSLASDGKRNTTLPPLSNGQPSTETLTSSNSGDMTQKSYRKVTVEMDKKIVTHLKRKLSKRSTRQSDTSSGQFKVQDDGEIYSLERLKSGKSVDGRDRLFSTYTETGEKIVPKSSRSKRRQGVTTGPDNNDLKQQSKTNGISTTYSPLNGRNESNLGCSDNAEDKQAKLMNGYVRDGEEVSDHLTPLSSKKKPEKMLITEISNIGSYVDEADVPIDGNELNSTDNSFHEVVVSPVQSPVTERAPTLDNEKHIFEDTMSEILAGVVNRPCPPDQTVVNFYIASGPSDFEAERSYMHEHMFPRLREYFIERGQEIRVLDLHWGFKDTIWDDHKIPEIIQKVINRTDETKTGINFVVLIGQKIGPKILPAEIPKDDFEAICAAASQYREEQLWLNSIKLSQIEVQKFQREKDLAISPDVAASEEGSLNDINEGDTNSDGANSRKVSSEQQAGETFSPAAEERRRRRSMAQRMEQQAIKLIKETEDNLPDLNTLTQWYLLDTNAVPPVYRLQNISTVFKDITRNDSAKRALAKVAFLSLASKFLALFAQFAPKSLNNTCYFEYITSPVFGREIEAILDNETARAHSLYLVRTIEDLTSKQDDQATVDYLDLTCDRPSTLDAEAHNKIERFRETVHKRKKMNVNNFLLEWSPGGIRPEIRREHQVHVERLARVIHDSVLYHRSDDQMVERNMSWKQRLFLEVSEHVRSYQEKSRHFHGHKEVLTQIKTYLKSQLDSPLVLYGKAGCGKSAIMAKTAKEVHTWLRKEDESPIVLIRMIGCTVNSTNVRELLRDVCIQLCYMFGQNHQEVPLDFKGIINDFNCRLSHSPSDRPLIILFDGLDRLSSELDGRKLQWLPIKLSPHVKVIVSTGSEDRLECLQAAKKLLAGNDRSFLEVGPLPEQEAVTLLNSWLDCARRSITEDQYKVVLSALKKCPNPLYLKIASTELTTWTSYMKPEWAKLGETVKKLATLRFGRLERDHGEPLVRRALGYITASRSGLTNNEMEDLLSLDDLVMDDIVSTYKPAIRRIPPLLWIRLKEDIGDLISEVRADNLKTFKWAHVDIFEAAEERYLLQRDKAPSYHKCLAEYFSSHWAGTPKPCKDNEKGCDRFISGQSLYYEPPHSLSYGDDRTYNLRKINELPYHLLRAQLNVQLKQLCLCNIEWMLGKLSGTSLISLLEEYQPIIALEPNDVELRLLYEVLSLSSKALKHDPRQLASQVLGRLTTILAADNPKSPGDVKKYPNLHNLVAAAKQSSIPALIPSISCLSEPGGVLCDQLSGHSEPITAFSMTTDGLQALTASKDKTMKLWDVRTGKVIKTIEGVGGNVNIIRTAKSNSLAITVEKTLIRIWSIKTDSCVAVIDQYIDPAQIAVTSDGQILVSVFDGSVVLRSWSLDNFTLICEVGFPDNSIHKDNSILIADSSNGDKVLHAFRSANIATVQSVRNGQIVSSLNCHDKSSAIVSLAISKDYYILCCRQQNVSLSEIHTLELFDALKNTYIRSIRGCPLDNIHYLYVNMASSHAIGVSFNKTNHTSDVVLFNLETEDHKHLAAHASVSTMGACLDFRYCITGAEGENFLRIWDISSKVNQPAPKFKKTHGVAEIWPMIDNPRYVVAKAINNGPISVWNVAKGKCLQSAVRIERGLAEGNDALVIRNTKLVILTDKGLSTVSEDPRPVFQTVLIYDLKLKKYVRKLTGCYIVPAPSHEYVLLDNDCLLGPSESRSHFVIWNMQTGHPVTRIKTAFKELERRRTDRTIKVVSTPRPIRSSSATMTPWDRRAESRSARQRRHEMEIEAEKLRLEELRKEKDNAVDQFIISGDQKIIVASFYAHHLCVFDLETKKHIQTLQTEYSMMLLHNAALTYDGGHLVHANYDEDSKLSYVTLWDLHTGEVKRRLRNESNVAMLAITDDAQRIVIGRAPNKLHVWDPMKPSSLKRIRGYEGLRFEINSKIFIIEDGKKAIVFAVDISVWDLMAGTIVAIFSPDTKITVCDVMLGGQIIVFGMYDRSDLVILRLMSDKIVANDDTGGLELFGETTGDTTDEDEDNEDDDKERKKSQ